VRGKKEENGTNEGEGFLRGYETSIFEVKWGVVLPGTMALVLI
jgi:hypothetical protein